MDFAAAFARADRIGGWLTEAQARLLWDEVRRLQPGSHVVEIGSHQGRSTVVLALASADVQVTAIDPFVEGRKFGGQPTRAVFETNTAGLGITLVPEESTTLRPSWTDPVDLLYVDGKHDYWTYVDDLRWSAHMPPGGEILVHDCFSSIGVTAGTVVKVLAGSRYTYVDRSRSLARFAVRRPDFADRRRVVAQLPWFLGNVSLKVLLRLRLRRVARLFGHHGPYDPF